MEEMEVRAKLTAEDEASPAVLALLANIRKLKAELSGFKAPPAVTRAMAAFGGDAVDKLAAMSRAVDGLAQAQERQATAAGRAGKAQAAVAQLRRGGGGSDVVQSVVRDQARVEAAVFRAWRDRERFKRRSTAVEERARAKAEAATFRAYKDAARMKRTTLAGEERQRRAADRAAEKDARAAHALFETHARLKLRAWRMGEVERVRGERAEQRRAAAEQRAADRRQAGGRRDMRAGLGRLAGTPGRLASRVEAFAPAAVVSAVTSGAVVAGLRGLLREESRTDDAEINARIAGGLSAEDARELRNKWAMPKSVEMGITTSEALRGWTEATKVGIPDASAKDFVGLSQKAAAALEVPIDRMNEVLGIINAQNGGKGDIKALSGVTNAMSYLADKLATTPDKLISFLQRGAGAATVLGMKQDMGLAFGAGATSLGIQAGSAGRLFDFIAGRTINLPNIVKKHGAEGQQARQAVQDLGYGNVRNMDKMRRADPDNFIFNLLERFSKIKDPRKRERDMRLFAGQEWFGELSSMVGHVDTVKQARDLAIEARKLDALGKRWELHRGKLSFLYKQMTAGTANILGSLGEEITPLAREAGDFYLKWSADISGGNLHTAFRRGLNGIVEGLLGKPGTLSDLMTGVFGAQGMRGQFDPTQFFAAARGFASGLRSTYDTVKAAFGGMAGLLGFDPSSIESMARFGGEFLGFALALRVARPVLGVLGLAADGLKALGVAATTLTAMEASGGLLATASGLIGFAGALGAIALAVEGLMKIGALPKVTLLPKDTSRDGVDEWLWGRNKDGSSARPAWVDKLTGGSAKPGDGLVKGPHGGLMPAPQAFHGEERLNWRDLMTPAAFHGDDLRSSWRTSEPLEDMRRDMRELRAAIQGGDLSGLRGGPAMAGLSYTGGGGGGIGGSFSPVGPGGNQATAPVNSFGLGRRGIMGGGVDMGAFGAGGTSRASGRLAANQREAYAAALGEGLSPTAARALVANMSGESLAKPNDYHWDRKHMSGGIVQWDPERSAAIKRQFGKLPWQMDVRDQTRASIWEIQNNPRFARTAAALRGNDPRAMVGALVTNYENPLDKPGAIRTRLGYLNGFNPDGAVAGGVNGGGLANLKRLGLTDEQCVTLAMAGVGIRKGSGVMGANVHDWRRGVDAAAGTLQPGQAVATFLNRNGSRSDLYAGGGAGTPGAHLDHAGVFQRYLMDGAGKRIGMEIAEQFKGSGGVHLKRYMFGQGWGEGNASNYSAVMTKDGKQLGGGNPAVAMIAADAEKAKRVAAMAQPKGGVASSVSTTGADLAASVPVSPTASLAGAIARGGAAQPGAAGTRPGAPQAPVGGGVTINVHGGSSDPEVIANKVHKRLGETMNWRAHDIETV